METDIGKFYVSLDRRSRWDFVRRQLWRIVGAAERAGDFDSSGEALAQLYRNGALDGQGFDVAEELLHLSHAERMALIEAHEAELAARMN